MVAYLGLDTLAVAGLAVAIALYEFTHKEIIQSLHQIIMEGLKKMASEETYNDTISEK